jgi:hypothetical protein
MKAMTGSFSPVESDAIPSGTMEVSGIFIIASVVRPKSSAAPRFACAPGEHARTELVGLVQ